jgi:glycosyltransferase involved in cell wall biosynthesis/GT2 family glycosyltransferase
LKNIDFISVVICTYNRAKYLESCIKSLKNQTYSNFEIIVVNGPSTDETNRILERYPKIKLIKQDKLNGLSFARNLGIEASNGEIIAFIDDDAVADENWIEYLIKGYVDESVGGVGGLVRSPKETLHPPVQFDRGTINKIGIPTAIRTEEEKLKKDEFVIIMGTNCSFRKDILQEVGGFDPYFRYYHDESDLCVRIAKKGYRIVYQRDAFVKHEMVEGHNRKSAYELNLSEIMKNTIYFILKNFNSELSSYTVRPIYSLLLWLKHYYILYRNKDIPLTLLFKISVKLVRGAIQGYVDGLKVNLPLKSSREINEHEKADSLLNYNKTTKTLSEDAKLKICFLSQEFSKNCNGGICRYTYDLAHALAESGNKVHVITKSERNREYEYRDDKVFVHEIIPEPIDFLALPGNMQISKKNLAYSYSACLKLLDLKEKFDIQIVEAPLWDAEGFVFSLVKNISLVIRIETPLFKVAEIQGWNNTTDLKLANWMEGEAIRRADKVIAISKDIGILISNHHLIQKEKIELCPLGIEVPHKNQLLNDQEKSDFIVLFVGRLEKRKGIETLFRAIPEVLEEVPDAQFYIVGKDTDLAPSGGSYKNYLLKNLDKKCHSNVKFIGYIEDRKLKNYYKDCNLFVAPSLYESFGLIFLEAMGWGKPVIGCDIGGIPEIVKDGMNGILIKPDDEKSLAEAIIRLLTDRDLRSKMGASGRRKVEDEFSVDKMSEYTHAIYRDVINHSKNIYSKT